MKGIRVPATTSRMVTPRPASAADPDGSPPILDLVPAAAAPSRSRWTGAGGNGSLTTSAFEQQGFALRCGIVLFLVGGVSALVGGLFSRGITDTARRGLLVVGGADIAVALVAILFRRVLWRRLTLLVMVLPALAIFGYGNYTTVDPYRADIYLFVIAVWVGIAQRRGVNLAMAPLYALAYWFPLSLRPHGLDLNQSVPYIVVVAVASGETVSWLASRLGSVFDRLRLRDQRRYAALDEESSDVTMVVDRLRRLSYTSASVKALVGCSAEDIAGRLVSDVMTEYVHPEDIAAGVAAYEAALATPMGRATLQVRIRSIDGTWHHVDVQIRNLIHDDVVGAVLLDFWDVNDRVEARAKLEASEESFRLLFQLSPLPTLVLDPLALRCLRVNDAACAHYGYTRDEFFGLTLVDLLSRAWAAAPVVGDPPPGGYLRPGLWRHQTKDGRQIEVEIAVNRARFGGVDVEMVLIIDVTEQRLLEDQLRHRALHDPLTGLANRALLLDRLDRALAASSRLARSVAVLICNLDGFKTVNDGLGQAAGDQVLREVAARLDQIVRPGDTLARLGADEFAVVVEDSSDPGGAQALAGRIVAALAEPFTLDGQHAQLSVSVGIAFGTSTVEGEELCRNADAAMSQAKVSGKNCYRVFEAALRAQARRRLKLSNDLRSGLDTR